MSAPCPSRNRLAGVLLALLLLCGGHRAQAATITWDGGGTNVKWDTLLNWDTDALPLTTDTVQFGSGFASGTAIDLNGNRTADSLIISTTTGISITNNNLTLSTGNITRNDVAGTEADQTISSKVVLGANGTWSIAGSGSLIVSGVVSGSFSLTKTDVGTLFLSGVNTYTGGTVINAGTVAVNNISSLGNTSGGLTINAGTLQVITGFTSTRVITLGDVASTILVDPAQTYTVSSAIGGAGTLNKTGTGTLTLTGTNTYTGGTVINDGTVAVNSSASLGNTSGGLTINAGTLQVTTGFTSTRVITLGDAASTILVNASQTYTVSSAIGGTGTLNKTGTGTLTLTGTNTYTGGTVINAGTVAVNSSTSLGNTSGGLTINAGTLQVTTGFTSTRLITLGDAASTIQVDPSQTYSMSGAIGGTGTLNKTGTGTLNLSGNNTFSGGVTLSTGTVGIGHNAALGTGTLTLTGGITIQASGGARTVSNAVTLAGNFSIGGSNDLTFGGAATLTGNRTITVDSTGTTTFSGAIGQNAAGRSLTKAGTGTLVLSGSNSYSGATTINAGVVNIRNANGLGTTAGGATVASGAALELQGGIAVGAQALTLNGTGIAGGGALRNVSGDNSWAGTVTLGSSFTISSDAGTLTISGTVNTGGSAANTVTYGGAGNHISSGVITNSGGVTKIGTGTLTLTGSTANTYTGDTAVNEGILFLDVSAINGAIVDTLTIGDGIGGEKADVVRYLRNTQINSGGGTGIVLKSSGWLDLNDYSDTVKFTSLDGGWITTGTGTLTLASNLTVLGTAGMTTYITGKLNLGGNRTFTVNDGAADVDMLVSAVVSGANSLNKSGAGTLVLSGANTYSGQLTLTSGTLVLGHDSATGTGIFKIGAGTILATGGARTISNTLDLDQNFILGGSLDLTFSGNAVLGRDIIITTTNTGTSTFSGAISGGLKLYKDGPGMLILSGANSQAETYVNAGVLNIRSVGALGSNKKTVVYSGGALELQGGLAMGAETLELYGSGISGGGAFRNVSGNNSWAGNVTLKAAATIASDSGTLTIGGNINTGVFAGTFSGAGDVTASGVVSGTGSLTKSGAGILTLSGVNTFSGGATINGGTVAVNSASSLGAAGVAATINSGTLRATETFTTSRNLTLGSAGSTIEADATKTLTATGVLSGSGGLTKTGAGTLTLSGAAANTFNGATTVSAGTLSANADGALGSTTKVTINTGGTVLMGVSTPGSNRISDTAEIALAGGTFNTGGFSETVGKMTLSGNSTFDFGAGASQMTFDGASSLGSSTLTVLNWTGTPLTSGGTDRLIFNNSSFTAGTGTSQVQFNIGGSFYSGTFISLGGTSLELVPVPEPATLFGAGALVLAIAWRERRLFARLLQRV